MAGTKRSTTALEPEPGQPPVICSYCGQPAKLVDSKEVYRRSYGPIWRCAPCGAYVGCHPLTTRPLGRLANAQLRAFKQRAHALFDPMWQAKMRRDGCSKNEARNAGYTWMAKLMKKSQKECHIGHFNELECQQAIAHCERIYELARAKKYRRESKWQKKTTT